MKYQGILLDLDNTLYDYSIPHNKGLNQVFSYCKKHFNISKEQANMAYSLGRHKVHIELRETASSHNRMLYIQKMLEILKIPPFKYAIELYNNYWDTFLEEMKLYDGVIELLKKYKGRVCIVSDLTAHIQYRKIQKLKIDKHLHFIVTSEEAGREKPHPYPFMLALQKLNLGPQDVCMIGDSFNKDIIGASNIKIRSFWINSNDIIQNYDDNLVTELKSFNEILDLI